RHRHHRFRDLRAREGFKRPVRLHRVGADLAVLGVRDVDEGRGVRAACQCRHEEDPPGDVREWFHAFLPLFHLAPFSASHFRITSATWRLFLSIIIMWLLPLMPMSGRTASAARPPAALIALTASRQPLRRASPLTVCLAPTLLSPHSESTGTLAKYEAASLSLKPSQPPSTVTSARTSFGRWR